MEPSDFWPGLSEMLEAHHGRKGRALGSWAAVSIAVALILTPWLMVATFAGGVALFVHSLVPVALFSRLVYVVLAVAIVVPGGWICLYVAARVLQYKMLKSITEERRQLREHWRKHNEDPAWHFVIRTPDEASQQRAEIMRVMKPYVEDVVSEVLHEQQEMENEKGGYGRKRK